MYYFVIFGLFPVWGYHKQFCSEYSYNVPWYKCVQVSLGIKNCGGSEIIPRLQANKSTYQNFMNVGRRHEIPGSEAKGNVPLTATVVARESVFVLVP